MFVVKIYSVTRSERYTVSYVHPTPIFIRCLPNRTREIRLSMPSWSYHARILIYVYISIRRSGCCSDPSLILRLWFAHLGCLIYVYDLKTFPCNKYDLTTWMIRSITIRVRYWCGHMIEAYCTVWTLYCDFTAKILVICIPVCSTVDLQEVHFQKKLHPKRIFLHRMYHRKKVKQHWLLF